MASTDIRMSRYIQREKCTENDFAMRNDAENEQFSSFEALINSSEHPEIKMIMNDHTEFKNALYSLINYMKSYSLI
jgi:hypothetical protein